MLYGTMYMYSNQVLMYFTNRTLEQTFVLLEKCY